jgi:hypothetical protein
MLCGRRLQLNRPLPDPTDVREMPIAFLRESDHSERTFCENNAPCFSQNQDFRTEDIWREAIAGLAVAILRI